MRENLLGYLLGALDASEQAEVEAALERHPHLREELEKLRRRLEPLESTWPSDSPPVGLAHRTCEFVLDQVSSESAVGLANRPRLSPSPGAGSYTGLGWSMSDTIVAAAVFVAASFLFFPAIARSRHATQVATCQNKLRLLGTQLAIYCQQKGDGRFPYIPPTGNESFAGMYASLLKDNDLLQDESLLLCPASPMSRRLSRFRVPTQAEIQSASGEQLKRLQTEGGGSYGFNVGYGSPGRHQAHLHRNRSHFAIMSDAADSPGQGQGRTSNHAGYGINLLYEDGRVDYVAGCVRENCPDNPLLNDDGYPAAGRTEDDAVVLPSWMAPFPRTAVYQH